MVYITGDMHGDIGRFKRKELRKLKKNDYLIVCGDFGFLWDASPKEKRILKWIGKRRYHVLFLEGSHDNLKLLSNYPKEIWNGGEVRRISGKLMHLCRGGIFDIDSHKVFVFGGGEAPHFADMPETEAWYIGSLPGMDEINDARANLRRCDNTVDFIITHQCSRKIKSFISSDREEANNLDAFLDEIRGTCKYGKWFFGSIHLDKLIPPAEVSLFEAFAEMKKDCTLIGAKRKKPAIMFTGGKRN